MIGYNPTGVVVQNSWGASWGVGGYFRLGWEDLDYLLQDKGDATVFVP